ncbi:MAG: sodium:solute symporter family protein [Alphaproteobacteria bacterium]|nr:sodium:solute symporter family protein [Alphaproteobacteria bacterium]
MTTFIIITYLALMLGIAFVVSRRQTVKSYVLNDRKTSLPFMVFSFAATFLGAGATVFIVAEAAQGSLLTGILFATVFPLSIIVFGILAPRIRSMGTKFNAVTIADFFGNRFGIPSRRLMVILQLVLIAMAIGTQIVAVSWLLSALLGISYATAAVLLFVVSMAYSAMGGLKMDIITDAIQFWLIILTFVLLGYFLLRDTSFLTVLQSTPPEMLNPFNKGNIAKYLMLVPSLFAYLIAGGIYWQLLLSAKSEKVVRKSMFISAGVVFLIQVLMVCFGIYAYNMLKGMANPDLAFFTLMGHVMPQWLTGLGLAAILAIVMSTLDSAFIAGSTMISNELLDKKKKVWSVRGITVAFAVAVFVITMIFPSISTLMFFGLTWLMIPVAAILLGMYGKKLSGRAAFWSMLMPMILTLASYYYLGAHLIMINPIVALIIILLFDKIFKKPEISQRKQI